MLQCVCCVCFAGLGWCRLARGIGALDYEVRAHVAPNMAVYPIGPSRQSALNACKRMLDPKSFLRVPGGTCAWGWSLRSGQAACAAVLSADPDTSVEEVAVAVVRAAATARTQELRDMGYKHLAALHLPTWDDEKCTVLSLITGIRSAQKCPALTAAPSFDLGFATAVASSTPVPSYRKRAGKPDTHVSLTHVCFCVFVFRASLA